MDETQQPGIRIGQIFLERAQFSHRDDALSLPIGTEFEPNLVVNFQGGVSPDEKAGFARVRVHTKAEDRPLYNFDVTVMVLLAVEAKQPNLSLRDYVRTAAHVMLYPFVREAVAGITWRGRFGPVWLKPFNITAGLSTAEASKAPRQTRRAAKSTGRPRTKAHS